jgi:extracellular factor (EF) 3-hydroxypalmitic acid methyl ester biosynthesis protein
MSNQAVVEIISSIAPEDKRPEILGFFNKNVAGYLSLIKSIEEELRQNKLPKQSTQQNLNKATKEIVENGYSLASSTNDRKLVNALKGGFRELIKPWMLKSLIMKRALEKPRGYPGDYQMLEYIYNGEPISKDIGYYFDKGFLGSELVRSVVNRKNLTKERIKSMVKVKHGLKILNLASGSCREIREMLKEEQANGFFLTCLDQDEEALAFSKNALKDRVDIKFIQDDILSVTKAENKNLLADKDLIYSIGLIDYLPDRVLKKIIKSLFDGLKPGASLLLSHKDHGVYSPIQEEWLSDWMFVPRDEKMMIGLLNDVGITAEHLEVFRESTGIIFFMNIRK